MTIRVNGLTFETDKAELTYEDVQEMARRSGYKRWAGLLSVAWSTFDRSGTTYPGGPAIKVRPNMSITALVTDGA
jgi:hypothetical protein